MRNNYFLCLVLIALCLSFASCSKDNQPTQPDIATASNMPAATATQPTSERSCADVDGVKAEVDLRMDKAQNVNVMNVTFIETQPSTDVIDKILRACISATSKLDGSLDILGTAWLRKNAGDDPNDDEIINNYGALNYLSYQASSKTIEVREMNFNKK